jgi:hypothetical protein
VGPETALGHHKPANWLFHPEKWKLEAPKASRPCLSEVDEILILILQQVKEAQREEMRGHHY